MARYVTAAATATVAIRAVRASPKPRPLIERNLLT
jgi:hypothetical protein